MPELPEVETTLRGLKPHLLGQTIQSTIVFQPKLRWPITPNLAQILYEQTIQSMQRRAKYLLIGFQQGLLIIHLGMSGSLYISEPKASAKKHEHVVFNLSSQQQLRYHDPRRFGSIHWHTGPSHIHPLLAHLGMEPLDSSWDGSLFWSHCQQQKRCIKTVLMDQRLVVGVGNIYAQESLFLAGIHPLTPANQLSLDQCQNLVGHVKSQLRRSIELGGTTLRDFVNPDGNPGYFQQTLHVYGKKDQTCQRCQSLIQKIVIAQRSTHYCPLCQPYFDAHAAITPCKTDTQTFKD